MIVMAGWHPLIQICGKPESMAVPHNPGIPDSQGRKQLLNLLAVGTVGVGKPPYRPAKQRFQPFPVLQDLMHHLRHGTSCDGGMGQLSANTTAAKISGKASSTAWYTAQRREKRYRFSWFLKKPLSCRQ